MAECARGVRVEYYGSATREISPAKLKNRKPLKRLILIFRSCTGLKAGVNEMRVLPCGRVMLEWSVDYFSLTPAFRPVIVQGENKPLKRLMSVSCETTGLKDRC
jgi:hypothetical protein